MAVQEEQDRAAKKASESQRSIKEKQERAIAVASAEAAAEASRKTRAEADAELVKLRRAMDTTALWYEDQLEVSRAEQDICMGK